jgi:hypothetical protein
MNNIVDFSTFYPNGDSPKTAQMSTDIGKAPMSQTFVTRGGSSTQTTPTSFRTLPDDDGETTFKPTYANATTVNMGPVSMGQRSTNPIADLQHGGYRPNISRVPPQTAQSSMSGVGNPAALLQHVGMLDKSAYDLGSAIPRAIADTTSKALDFTQYSTPTSLFDAATKAGDYAMTLGHTGVASAINGITDAIKDAKPFTNDLTNLFSRLGEHFQSNVQLPQSVKQDGVQDNTPPMNQSIRLVVNGQEMSVPKQRVLDAGIRSLFNPNTQLRGVQRVADNHYIATTSGLLGGMNDDKKVSAETAQQKRERIELLKIEARRLEQEAAAEDHQDRVRREQERMERHSRAMDLAHQPLQNQITDADDYDNIPPPEFLDDEEEDSESDHATEVSNNNIVTDRTFTLEEVVTSKDKEDREYHDDIDITEGIKDAMDEDMQMLYETVQDAGINLDKYRTPNTSLYRAIQSSKDYLGMDEEDRLKIWKSLQQYFDKKRDSIKAYKVVKRQDEGEDEIVYEPPFDTKQLFNDSLYLHTTPKKPHYQPVNEPAMRKKMGLSYKGKPKQHMGSKVVDAPHEENLYSAAIARAQMKRESRTSTKPNSEQTMTQEQIYAMMKVKPKRDLDEEKLSTEEKEKVTKDNKPKSYLQKQMLAEKERRLKTDPPKREIKESRHPKFVKVPLPVIEQRKIAQHKQTQHESIDLVKLLSEIKAEETGPTSVVSFKFMQLKPSGLSAKFMEHGLSWDLGAMYKLLCNGDPLCYRALMRTGVKIQIFSKDSKKWWSAKINANDMNDKTDFMYIVKKLFGDDWKFVHSVIVSFDDGLRGGMNQPQEKEDTVPMGNVNPIVIPSSTLTLPPPESRASYSIKIEWSEWQRLLYPQEWRAKLFLNPTAYTAVLGQQGIVRYIRKPVYGIVLQHFGGNNLFRFEWKIQPMDISSDGSEFALTNVWANYTGSNPSTNGMMKQTLQSSAVGMDRGTAFFMSSTISYATMNNYTFDYQWFKALYAGLQHSMRLHSGFLDGYSGPSVGTRPGAGWTPVLSTLALDQWGPSEVVWIPSDLAFDQSRPYYNNVVQYMNQNACVFLDYKEVTFDTPAGLGDTINNEGVTKFWLQLDDMPDATWFTIGGAGNGFNWQMASPLREDNIRNTDVCCIIIMNMPGSDQSTEWVNGDYIRFPEDNPIGNRRVAVPMNLAQPAGNIAVLSDDTIFNIIYPVAVQHCSLMFPSEGARERMWRFITTWFSSFPMVEPQTQIGNALDDQLDVLFLSNNAPDLEKLSYTTVNGLGIPLSSNVKPIIPRKNTLFMGAVRAGIYQPTQKMSKQWWVYDLYPNFITMAEAVYRQMMPRYSHMSQRFWLSLWCSSNPEIIGGAFSDTISGLQASLTPFNFLPTWDNPTVAVPFDAGDVDDLQDVRISPNQFMTNSDVHRELMRPVLHETPLAKQWLPTFVDEKSVGVMSLNTTNPLVPAFTESYLLNGAKSESLHCTFFPCFEHNYTGNATSATVSNPLTSGPMYSMQLTKAQVPESSVELRLMWADTDIWDEIAVPLEIDPIPSARQVGTQPWPCYIATAIPFFGIQGLLNDFSQTLSKALIVAPMIQATTARNNQFTYSWEWAVQAAPLYSNIISIETNLFLQASNLSQSATEAKNDE